MCKEEFAKAIDKAIFPGTQGGPLMHVIAGKAVCFGEALKPGFKEYQKQVLANSKALADALLGYGFDLVSGGSDNHLIRFTKIKRYFARTEETKCIRRLPQGFVLTE